MLCSEWVPSEWESKQLNNKSTIKTFLTWNRGSCFRLFWLVNSAWSVQISLLIQTRLLFIWRKRYYMDSYFNWNWFEVKNILMVYLFLTNMQLLLYPDVNWWTWVVWITCGLLLCFYQLFGLSFWRHPFTAEHPGNWANWISFSFCDVFISCLDSHSDGTHSLQSILETEQTGLVSAFVFSRC